MIRSPVAGCRFENKWLVKKERDVFLGNGFCKPATGNWQLLRMNGAGRIRNSIKCMRIGAVYMILKQVFEEGMQDTGATKEYHHLSAQIQNVCGIPYLIFLSWLLYKPDQLAE